MNITEKVQNMTHTILDRVLSYNHNTVSAILLLLGVLTIVIIANQLWFLRTKFRREVNTLFVVIEHLCVADMLNGVMVTGSVLLSFSQWLVGNALVARQIIEFIALVSKTYLFAVSILTLDTLVVLKMLKIAKNRS